jgi:hypothetical protein
MKAKKINGLNDLEYRISELKLNAKKAEADMETSWKELGAKFPHLVFNACRGKDRADGNGRHESSESAFRNEKINSFFNKFTDRITDRAANRLEKLFENLFRKSN